MNSALRTLLLISGVFGMLVAILSLAERRFPPPQLVTNPQFSPVFWITSESSDSDNDLDRHGDPDSGAGPFSNLDLVTDPSLFLNPSFRPGGVGSRVVVSIESLSSMRPALPRLPVSEYGEVPGILLMEKNPPAEMPLPTLAESQAWEVESPESIEPVVTLNSLPFEIEGPLVLSPLTYWPQEDLKNPPPSGDGVSRISLSVSPAGVVTRSTVIEPGTTPDNIAWLNRQVRRLRFSSEADKPSSSREGVFIYYWEKKFLDTESRL